MHMDLKDTCILKVLIVVSDPISGSNVVPGNWFVYLDFEAYDCVLRYGVENNFSMCE
jgi:hypothetical protein